MACDTKSSSYKIVLSTLKNYIINNTERDKEKQTHMWFGSSKILFRVEDSEYDNFVNMVSNVSSQSLKYEDEEALHILERPLDVGILCIDIDIKFRKKLRHEDFIEPMDIISKINAIVKKYFVLSSELKELEAYYLTKDYPYYDEKSKTYSDGIHITYPNLVLSSENKKFILDMLTEQIIQKEDMEDLLNVLILDVYEKKNQSIYYDKEDNVFLNDKGEQVDLQKEKIKLIDSIFDRCVLGQTKWFMYGSGKENYKVKHAYKIKYIFDANLDTIDNVPDTKDLVKILCLRNKNKTETEIKKKYMNNKSIKNHKNQENQENCDTDDKSNERKTVKLYNEVVYDISLVKKLVKLLSKERAEPYSTWRNVGLILHNISDTLFPEFIEFSKKSAKYDFEGCNKFWKTCKTEPKDKKLTIASLKFWAKEDNPEEYDKMFNEYLNTCSIEDTNKINEILKNLKFERDYEVAKLIHSLYKRKFKCACITNQSWFHFANHRWYYSDAGYKLDNLMSEHFTKYVHNLYEQLTIEHLKNISDEGIKKKKDDYYKFITKLNKTVYKKTLMAECAKLFYDEKFEIKLNEIAHLVGFENGVYDLKNNEFRDGVPEDYITFSTGYNYNLDYNETHPDIMEIEHIIKLIQPNDEIRLFMMCHIASILEGGNSDQIIVFWIGPGGQNGKSTIEKLIEYAFGDYCQQMENTVLTKPRPGSSAPTPELANKKGVRITLIHEPEQQDKIHGGFLKQLTGQDQITTRGLYEKKQVSFLPLFKMLLIANYFTEFTSINDAAVWRRIRAIEFTQKFVTNPKAPNEHLIDKKLPVKLKTLRGAFMWLLINKYYPIYVKRGLDNLTPDIIKNYTKKYEEASEPYLQFCDDNIQFCPSGEMIVDEVKNSYIAWYANSVGGKPVKPGGIIDYFISKGCVKRGKLIKGITLKDMYELANDSLVSELDN